MLVDSHAHLDDERFASDIGEVLTRAAEAGVGRVVTVGTGIASCEKAIALAHEKAGQVSAAVGIDPHHAATAEAGALDRLAELARDPRVVAVGETGLEYHYGTSSRESQRRIFEFHIRLALDANLPLVVHCREAFEDCLAILQNHAGQSLRGVAHCFTGDIGQAEAFLKLGFCVSFGGIVTFPNAKALREVARRVPLEKVLVETDAPYLAPQARRGKRNEPAYVKYVADALAEIRGISVAEVGEATSANAIRLFEMANPRAGVAGGFPSKQ